MRIFRLVDRTIECDSVATLDMAFGRIEMRITRYYIAFVNEIREEYVLGCTTLVGRYYIFETCERGYHLLHVHKGTCSGITLVAHHHARPLTVGHSACTGVGKQVYIYLLGFELK